jgi:GABA permease
MHNPLRSETEAFRATVAIVAGAGAVVAVALATEPAYGAILAGVLVGFGVGLAWQRSRGREPHKAEIAPGGGTAHRILVIANETVGGGALLSEIANRARGRKSEILVVVPAIERSRLEHWTSDTDRAVDEARDRLSRSLAALGSIGLSARGEVGDSEPNVAIEDALANFAADELIVSTHPPQRSRWLERGVVDRAREEVDLPITHVVVDLERESSRTVAVR